MQVNRKSWHFRLWGWFRWCFAGEPEELDPEPFLKKLKENS